MGGGVLGANILRPMPSLTDGERENKERTLEVRLLFVGVGEVGG